VIVSPVPSIVVVNARIVVVKPAAVPMVVETTVISMKSATSEVANTPMSLTKMAATAMAASVSSR
jgi:hypothetical protein